MINQKHQELLIQRGIDPETASKHGVISVSSPFDGIDFQYYREGSVVNHHYRTIGEEKRFQQQKGGHKCFWNYDAIAKYPDEPLIITEGQFDALACIEAGYNRVVSVPDGAPSLEIGDRDSAKYSYLDDASEVLQGISEIILATDGDDAGHNLMNDLALRLVRARCKWVKYPLKCKDLNDAHKLYPKDGVAETIKRAKWIAIDGVFKMSDLPPVSNQKALSTGMEGMDPYIKARKGDFWIVTGIPSMGKTTWVNDLMCSLVETQGWNIAVGSFEQSPQTDHKRNLMHWHAQCPSNELSFSEEAKALGWIDDNFSFIVPNEDDDATFDWILERMASCVTRFGADMIILDPWNEMDHKRPDGMTITEYVGYCIKQLKKFAKKYNALVLVVAHPSKLKPLKAGQQTPKPTLYDISDSAHWYNKPDIGIVIHRDKEKGQTLCCVEKVRYHGLLGSPADVSVIFNQQNLRFTVETNKEGYE